MAFCFVLVFNTETHLKYICLVGDEIGIKVNNWQTVHSNEFVQWLFIPKLQKLETDCSPDVVKKKDFFFFTN